MDSEDDMDLEDENEEILEHETPTLALLRGNNLIVKNSDGITLRCPLSPSRKKQAYAYKDLLQHATAVASGKRGPEAAGKHSALKKFLETDLKSMSTPPPDRLLKAEQNLPRRGPAEDMRVCPWSVVIYNIDNSRRDPTKPETRVGLGKTELRLFFKVFKPIQLEVCWGPRGHMGMCVLHFGRELSGLKDAEALGNYFLDKEHGLRDYERRLASGDLGKEFYGWLAREADYNGRRCGWRGEEIGKYLRKVGNLKDIEMIGDESKRMHDQQVRHLSATVSEKSKESQGLKTEMEILRRRAEAERLQMEESHKIELEAVQTKARNAEEEYNQANLETVRALEKRETELSQLDKELREKETQINSAAEKNRLQAQMMENRQLREALANQQVLLQHKQVDKIKLLLKHEEETLKLAEHAQKESLKLKVRQQIEMEREQLQSMLETEKLFDKLTIKPDSGHERKKIEELEKKLEELESTKECQEDTITTLMVKERESNDELVDGQKMAVKVIHCIDQRKQLIEAALKKKEQLDKTEEPEPKVEVKRAGEIDNSAWLKAFQEKYKNHADCEDKMTEVLSSWETRIRDPEFQPFKMVKIGEDKWEQHIDDGDEELAFLKETYGKEVYNSVTTALMEIEEYNASGRYPIPIAWNFEKSRKASLKEVIQYLGRIIKSLVPPARKRARN